MQRMWKVKKLAAFVLFLLVANTAFWSKSAVDGQQQAPMQHLTQQQRVAPVGAPPLQQVPAVQGGFPRQQQVPGGGGGGVHPGLVGPVAGNPGFQQQGSRAPLQPQLGNYGQQQQQYPQGVRQAGETTPGIQVGPDATNRFPVSGEQQPQDPSRQPQQQQQWARPGPGQTAQGATQGQYQPGVNQQIQGALNGTKNGQDGASGAGMKTATVGPTFLLAALVAWIVVN